MDWSRRRMLGAASMVAVSAAAPRLAQASTGVRKLGFHNLHTDEALDVAYWEDGAYVPDALAAVNRVLRDFRTGDEHVISPRLLDLLNTLSARLETGQRFQVISGYRSPTTNAALHARSGEVATGSLHMLGEAIDIRVPGVELTHLHDAALSLGAGGVGYYPSSDFVHVDVGRVRRWSGS
ncbi:DUF882 domain-containing protein [Caulobacter sp. KR2-114]|uniref:DUF882 domain-containing protein n=1 Tax=Caulobacter sp. KR2-114 TaxID=3400912 RepID=UPI003C0A4E85